MSRKERKREQRPTPKGEAQRTLQHAKNLLRELEQLTTPNKKNEFVRRFNDFLRSARTVDHFLGKESRHRAGLNVWLRKERERLYDTDNRYRHFMELRDVSAHDCLVEPSKGEVSVEVADRMRMSGSMEGELRDASSGRPVAQFSYSAPVDAESTFESKKTSMTYFLAEWQEEDILTFCQRVTECLQRLVSRAYQLYP